jgi:hypothetical protein
MCGSATLMIEMSSDYMKVPSMTETAISHFWTDWPLLSTGPPEANATAAEPELKFSLMEAAQRRDGTPKPTSKPAHLLSSPVCMHWPGQSNSINFQARASAVR